MGAYASVPDGQPSTAARPVVRVFDDPSAAEPCLAVEDLATCYSVALGDPAVAGRCCAFQVQERAMLERIIDEFVASFFAKRPDATLRLACNYMPGMYPHPFDAAKQDELRAKLRFLACDLGPRVRELRVGC